MNDSRARLYAALQRTEKLAQADCDGYLKIMHDAAEELLGFVALDEAGQPQPLGDNLAEECKGFPVAFEDAYPAKAL